MTRVGSAIFPGSEISMGLFPGRSKSSMKPRPGTSRVDGTRPPFTESELKTMESKTEANSLTRARSTQIQRLRTLAAKSMSYTSSKQLFTTFLTETQENVKSDVLLPKSQISLSMSSMAFLPLKELHLDKENIDKTIQQFVKIKSLRNLIRPSALEIRQDLDIVRRNAYCFGRGFLEPPLPLVHANYPETPTLEESEVHSYEEFWDKIEELEESNTSNKQVICVFTTSVADGPEECYNDCHWIKTAIIYIKEQVVPSGYLLWVWVGTRNFWQDPNNLFKRDPQLKLKALPTIIVWNTEKRAAGKKVFDPEILTTLFED